MILAINTAQRIHELALLENDKVLAEKIWDDERRDVEDLVPFLKTLLEERGLSKSDITEIVVVNGPGSFTSLRTGVAFSNALAEGLNAKLYTLNTFELLKRKAAIKDPLIVVVQAGGLDVGIQQFGIENQEEGIRIGPMASLLNDYPHDHEIHVVTELNETQNEELHPMILEKKWTLIAGHELQSFGESLVTFGVDGLKKVDTVEPYYLKAPNITKSSDPWKK